MQRVSPRIALPAILVLGLGLRLIYLGRGGLWNDEIFSALYAREIPVLFQWTHGLGIETNPPLFYTLLRFWMSIFGESEVALRMLPVIFSCGLIPLVYLLGKKLSGPAIGLVASFLVAVSAFQIYYAQEVRSYALACFASAALLLGFGSFLKSMHGASTKKWRMDLCTYTLGGVLGLYSHFTFLFLILASQAGLYYFLRRSPPSSSAPLLGWATSQLTIVFLGAPILNSILVQKSSPNIDWIPQPGWTVFKWMVDGHVYGSALSTDLGFVCGLAFLTCVIYLNLRKTMATEEWITYVMVPLICLLTMGLVSFFRPVLLARTTYWISIPFYLLMARAVLLPVSYVSYIAKKIFLVMVTAIVATSLVAYFFNDRKERWGDLASALQKQIDASFKPVFCHGTNSFLLEFYSPGLTRTQPLRLEALIPQSLPTREISLTAEDYLSAVVNKTEAISRAEFSERITSHRKTFLVIGGGDLDSVTKFLAVRPPDFIVTAKGGLSAYIWR